MFIKIHIRRFMLHAKITNEYNIFMSKNDLYVYQSYLLLPIGQEYVDLLYYYY